MSQKAKSGPQSRTSKTLTAIKKNKIEFESSDSDPEPTRKKGSRSKKGEDDDYQSSSKKPTKLSDSDVEKLSSEVVRLILFHDFQKNPCSRDLLSKTILKSSRATTQGAFSAIIKEAERKFKEIFRFELLSLDREDPQLEKAKYYILRPILDHTVTQKAWKESAQSSSELTFLTVILGLVELSPGRTLLEETLREAFFPRLGFTDKTHDHFGEWEKTFDKFFKQKYLVRTKDKDQRWLITMGPTAHHLIGRLNVYKFLEHIFGEKDLSRKRSILEEEKEILAKQGVDIPEELREETEDQNDLTERPLANSKEHNVVNSKSRSSKERPVANSKEHNVVNSKSKSSKESVAPAPQRSSRRHDPNRN